MKNNSGSKKINNKSVDSLQKDCNKNTNEKIGICSLIMLVIVLAFIAQFYIHDIISVGKSKDGTEEMKSVELSFYENEENNNIAENNYIEGNVQKSEKNKDNIKSKTDDNNIAKKEEEIINNYNRIIISESTLNGDINWEDKKELDMFNNAYFNDRAIIAPGVEGSYTFTVENKSSSKFNYQINFIEENPYNVNMVYKLKKNGEYIVGNESQWKDENELNVFNLKLDSVQRDVYTVEWRWEDTSYDTSIGVLDDAYYKMYVDVQADQITQ